MQAPYFQMDYKISRDFAALRELTTYKPFPLTALPLISHSCDEEFCSDFSSTGNGAIGAVRMSAGSHINAVRWMPLMLPFLVAMATFMAPYTQDYHNYRA